MPRSTLVATHFATCVSVLAQQGERISTEWSFLAVLLARLWDVEHVNGVAFTWLARCLLADGRELWTVQVNSVSQAISDCLAFRSFR